MDNSLSLSQSFKIKNFFQSTGFILFFAIVCIILEFQIPIFYQHFFTNAFDMLNDFNSLIFFLSVTTICFFVLPSFFIYFLLKENIFDYGWCWPDKNRRVWLLFFITLPIGVICIDWLSQKASFQQYYGGIKHLFGMRFFILQPLISIIYYIAEEFFFRGFLFLMLWKKIRWHSLWLTELIFAAAHLAKPDLEILFSIPVGIVLNILTLWSRSILPAIFFHSILGISLIFCI